MSPAGTVSEQSAPPRKRVKLDFSEALTVAVGKDENQRLFMVHKDVITRRSPFFEAACAERWSKSGDSTDKSGPVELPHVEYYIFSIYLQCVYENCVVVGDTVDSRSSEEEVSDVEVTFLRLAKTHALAEYLGDLRTANMVVDKLIAISYDQLEVPQAPTIRFVYGETPGHGPLRRLMTEWYIHEATLETVQSAVKAENIPSAFACDVMVKMAQLVLEHRMEKVGDIFWAKVSGKRKCEYHLHDKITPKCAQDREDEGLDDDSDEPNRDESDRDDEESSSDDSDR